MAVIAVFGFHARIAALGGGWAGADVFFVLSGYLITSVLVRQFRADGRIRLPDFYLRRVRRLFPALAAMLALTALVATWLPPLLRARLGGDVEAALLYVANLRLAFRPGSAGPLIHTWTLSLEEQFYVLWPPVLALVLARRRRPGALLAGLAVVVVAAPVWRVVLAGAGVPAARIIYATDTRADTLLLGCLLGLVVSFDLLPRGRWVQPAVRVAAWLGAAWLVWCFAGGSGARSFDRFTITFGFSLIALATAAVILGLVTAPACAPARALGAAPVAWVGRLSYAIYLVHLPILLVVQAHMARAGVGARVLVAVAVTVPVAFVIHHAVERPFLRTRPSSIAHPIDRPLLPEVQPVTRP